ncbi:MAG: DegT/DnrJ/EryC1/StrS family aminotransferase [Candidatus Electrothrix sp. AW5]|nr:DegT/DnrJ/EryC1/StrS family aminotransferase [Candidatus Electrothrix gigas]
MIHMNNFQAESSELRLEMLQAAKKVFESGWYVLGQEVASFEKVWAQHCDSAYCIGVGNGLDAIEIGLRALGIGFGDEVITTAMTAYATTLAIQRIGAIPVYADIDSETANLEPDSVERCVSKRTKAVLVVHIYGQAADLGRIKKICQDNSLELIEDCAQAHGARYNGQSVGSFGRFGAWSFYPSKNLGAIGDAGAITTQDNELACRMKQLRNYGQVDRYHHDIIGLNSRLDELQAALLTVRLKYLTLWTETRRKIAAIYKGAIFHPSLQLLAHPFDLSSHVYHLFVLRTNNRQAVREELSEAGILTLIHYPVSAIKQKALKKYRIDPKGLPQTEDHCNSCFSLPIHPFLTDDEIDQIVTACNSLPKTI